MFFNLFPLDIKCQSMRVLHIHDQDCILDYIYNKFKFD